jgi:predicted HAD superfamily Cof-like phosphohydrolase
MNQETAVLEQRIQELESEKRTLQRQVDDLHNDLSRAETERRSVDRHHMVCEYFAAAEWAPPTSPECNQEGLLWVGWLVDEFLEVLEAFGCFTNETLTVIRLSIRRGFHTGKDANINFVGVIHELCDLILTAEAALAAFGAHSNPLLKEIHGPNTKKLRFGMLHKALKPPGWQPPNVRGELLRQGWRPNQ